MTHRVVFFNEFDIFKNNSAGITVRDLFGNEFCYNSLQLSLVNGYILAKQSDTVLLHERFNIFAFFRVDRFIRSYGGEIIYTTGTSVRALFILFLIKIFTRIPILVHYFDNWRECNHSFAKNCLIRFINGRREIALVISDSMKEYYEKKYGGEYETLMVGSSVLQKSVLSKCLNEQSDKCTFSFLYCGGFHLDRYKALLEVEGVLSRLPEYRSRLIIATFKDDYDRYSHLFNPQVTCFYIDLPHESVNSLFEESDALLFVEPAPERYFNFLRFSMSTKIPEYLASGLPIICYSDPRISPYQYFSKTGSAFMATNLSELKRAIIKVLNNDNISNVVENALSTVEIDFSSSIQRDKVSQVVDSLTSKNVKRK